MQSIFYLNNICGFDLVCTSLHTLDLEIFHTRRFFLSFFLVYYSCVTPTFSFGWNKELNTWLFHLRQVISRDSETFYVSCISATETSHPSNTSAQSNRKDPAWSVTPGLLREHTQHGHDGPLPAATFSSPQAAGVIRAGCSRWLDSGPAITSSTDTVGFSSVKQVCTGVGSHNRQVITSSSSSANSQNDDRIVGEKKNNSGDTSYPDNELRIMLSTCGSGSKDQPSLHSSEETCMLQTASGM